MSKSHFLILEARFYQQIADDLKAGAVQVFEDYGASYEIYAVPGAYELPAALKFGIESGQFSGAIALGCVVRGKTSHYDHICDSAFQSLQDLVTQYSFPFGMGILTCEDQQQAAYRADPSGPKNVGGAAAQAAVRMLELKSQLLSDKRLRAA